MNAPDDDVSPSAFIERRPTGALIPVIPVGRWAVDPARSKVSFVAKHLLVSKVTGTFTRVAGTIVVGEDAALSSVSAMADAASLTTGDAARDEHLRSADFFDVDQWPTISITGSGLRSKGGRHALEGILTIRDISHPVNLTVTATNLARDGDGHPVATDGVIPRPTARFTAEAVVNRKDFGLVWNAAIETGGVVVGDMVRIDIVAIAELQP
jgi:polyisoprenoid-binding protein YceI